MIELLLAVFLACGQPVFVILQPVGKDMKVYSKESMGKARWDEFLLLIEESKGDPGVAWLELPVEKQTDIACMTKT